MFFLIEYERKRGEVVELRIFDDSERRIAEDARLEIELTLGARRVEHEVVILDAASEDAIRRTHRRYFENLSELMQPI